MKLFDVNWDAVLEELQRWYAMPIPARRTMLEHLTPNTYVTSNAFGAHLDAIVASGIPRYDAEKHRLSLPIEQRPLLKVLRAMGRHRIFNDASMSALLRYLDDHFSLAEIEQLGRGRRVGGYHTITKHSIATRVAYASWPGDLLAAGSDVALLQWAETVGISPAFGTSLADLRALHDLAKRLVVNPAGTPLREVVAQCDKKQRDKLGRALQLGFATLVLFGGLRNEDDEPLVGLWPPAALELTRPPAEPPVAVEPIAQFEFPVLMEDMTAVLAEVVATPVRLRAADGVVFARTAAAIETRLTPIPPWAEPMMNPGGHSRVERAARQLEAHELVKVHALRNQPHLVVTAAGSAWLARAPRERLESLIAPWRKAKAESPTGMYDLPDPDDFFPYTFPYLHAPKGLKLRAPLTEAFLGLGKRAVRLDDFLEYASREANPMLRLPVAASNALQASLHLNYLDPRDALPNLWWDALRNFLAYRLLVVGGARLGHASDGALTFAITDIGRYVLGARDSLVYGDVRVADVVVQPNFDVVFLGAAPSVEAALARFSERVGVAPGLVFRITRGSVLAAAESGQSGDDVLRALDAACSKPVPANVRREITGWMASVRRARMRVLQAIECGDAQTGERVASALGAKAKRLTPTLFELDVRTPAARAAVIKRLRAAGVFLEEDQVETAAPKQRRARSPRWQDPLDDDEF